MNVWAVMIILGLLGLAFSFKEVRNYSVALLAVSVLIVLYLVIYCPQRAWERIRYGR